MSNSHDFLRASLKQATYDVVLRQEVTSVVEDLVSDVELWWYENITNTLNYKLHQEQARCAELEHQVLQLQKDKRRVEEHMETQRKQAAEVRDKFLQDMASTFRDVMKQAQLREKLAESEKRILSLSKAQRELKLAQKRIKELERWRDSDVAGPNSSSQSSESRQIPSFSLENASDKVLLKVFRFMNSSDVMMTRQLSRAMFKRIDAIFEIGSNLAYLHDKHRSNTSNTNNNTSISNGRSPATTGAGDMASPSSQGASSSSEREGASGLTSAMAEQLTRKLTNVEMKAILAMTDKLRKQAALVHQLKADKEDLVTRLQGVEKVKDFLASSLHEKEVELKQVCEEQRTLLRQKTTDSEVVTFLDEQVLQYTEEMQEGVKTQNHLKQLLDLEKTNNAQQTARLQSTVEMLRSEKEVLETKTRTERKKLVKEVKILRTHLNEIQSERDEYKAQLDLLLNTLNVIRPRSNSTSHSHHSMDYSS